MEQNPCHGHRDIAAEIEAARIIVEREMQLSEKHRVAARDAMQQMYALIRERGGYAK